VKIMKDFTKILGTKVELRSILLHNDFIIEQISYKWFDLNRVTNGK
jgi:hypothetical protein